MLNNLKLNNLNIRMAESGYLPDYLLRNGIRRLLKSRLNDISEFNKQSGEAALETVMKAMDQAPVAALPDKANQQHYELPAEFFARCLGNNLKYSCGYWPEGCNSLDDAELEALAITFERAQLMDGKSILELGCGWGSLSFYMAHRLPNSTITSVSNSHSQAEYIRQRAIDEGLKNLNVITADMNHFSIDQTFDRVVSIEMFEHMRNWRVLFHRVSNWLKPGGLLFMHIFVHKHTPYFYEDETDDDWMARYFFSGGVMPSIQLPNMFNEDLIVEQSWEWSGQHYEKTCNAWLKNMDSQKKQLMPLFRSTYGKAGAAQWWVRWRLFYMACAELFGYKSGNEWRVAHYRLSKR